MRRGREECFTGTYRLPAPAARIQWVYGGGRTRPPAQGGSSRPTCIGTPAFTGGTSASGDLYHRRHRCHVQPHQCHLWPPPENPRRPYRYPGVLAAKGSPITRRHPLFRGRVTFVVLFLNPAPPMFVKMLNHESDHRGNAVLLP